MKTYQPLIVFDKIKDDITPQE